MALCSADFQGLSLRVRVGLVHNARVRTSVGRVGVAEGLGGLGAIHR